MKVKQGKIVIWLVLKICRLVKNLLMERSCRELSINMVVIEKGIFQNSFIPKIGMRLRKSGVRFY